MNTFNKTVLIEALSKVKPGLASKEVNDQITSFIFSRNKILTFNNEIGLIQPISFELEGIIKADEFYSFLSKVKEETIDYNISENELILSAGKAKAGFVLQQEIKIPIDEILYEGEWFNLPSNFNSLLPKCFSSCSTDLSNPILTTIHINKDGFCISSDGFRITKIILNDVLPVDTFLIPLKSAIQIIKINPVQIAEKEGWIYFKNEDGTILSCRVYNEKYPSTDRLFEIKEGKEIIFPKKITESLEKASIFSLKESQENKLVDIYIENKKLKIKSASQTGWFEEILNINYQGPNLSFAVSPDLLKDILKEEQTCILDDNKLKFAFTDWFYVTCLQ